MLSLCEEITFWFRSSSFSADITSGVKEVTSTYCTGCRKRSVGLPITRQPTGPFQSNNTLYQNYIPKVICTATCLQANNMGAAQESMFLQKWDQAFKGPCSASAAFCHYDCKPKEIEMHKLILFLPITIVSIIITVINGAAVVVAVPLHSFVSTEHQETTGIVPVPRPLYWSENHWNLLNYNHISFCNNWCVLSIHCSRFRISLFPLVDKRSPLKTC